VPNTVSITVKMILIAALCLAIAGCMRSGSITEKPMEVPVAKQQTYSYSRDIKPIFDHKCIACHACYDAPCQLKLNSPQGLLRGATPDPVYDGTRLHDASPTRLFVDAHSRAQWRQKGFFSVLNDQGGTPDDNLANSTLARMIELGRENRLPPNTPVPAEIELGLARKNECPTPDEFASYAKDKPQQGMPLAITGLSDAEYRTLRQWIHEGAVVDETPAPPSPQEQIQIQQWESFLNQPAPRNRLVSRYLYEHLYPAHLYFEELDTGNFYQLVRSSTAAGQPIRIVATLRPNDDPGTEFHYRLRKVDSTIVYKTHMPYPLGKAKIRRFEQLFLSGDWQVTQLPDYSRKNGLNPMATFNAIPAGARYRFMLDTAKYFISTFIRGPVCAGQVATNVIDDHFFVMFQHPEKDLSVTNEAYQAAILPHLELVPVQEHLVGMVLNWWERSKQMNKYLNLRGQYYRELMPQGMSLDDIWYGDGTNTNAALTVFRNFDNAMVTKGFVGADPKTLWVMDYPMLERTYYLLVVNFNVFGSVASQAETRLYFDLIRANGENNFLHFMPPDARVPLRDSWYVGSDAQTKISKSYDVVNDDMPVQIPYRGADPKGEFISLVSQRLKSLSGFPDVINRCDEAPCYSAEATPQRRRVEASLQTLPSKTASTEGMRFVDFMPDVAFLRISGTEPEFAFTLIRNKAHTNVAFMLDEEERRERDKDTLTIYPGLLGSYPNFMFNVPLDQIETFTRALHEVDTIEHFGQLVGRYGLMRTNPDIWTNFHWFVDYMRLNHPLHAGVYDLSRYKKVAELMADESY
jgi:Fatty acid cis/trans isomerase (CTI)